VTARAPRPAGKMAFGVPSQGPRSPASPSALPHDRPPHAGRTAGDLDRDTTHHSLRRVTCIFRFRPEGFDDAASSLMSCAMPSTRRSRRKARPLWTAWLRPTNCPTSAIPRHSENRRRFRTLATKSPVSGQRYRTSRAKRRECGSFHQSLASCGSRLRAGFSWSRVLRRVLDGDDADSKQAFGLRISEVVHSDVMDILPH
jgi:hypothetical protein